MLAHDLDITSCVISSFRRGNNKTHILVRSHLHWYLFKCGPRITSREDARRIRWRQKNGNLKHSSQTGKHRIKLRQSYLGAKAKAQLCGRATTQLSDFCDPFPSAVDVNKDVYFSRRFSSNISLSQLPRSRSPLPYFALLRISRLFVACLLRAVGTCIDTSFENREIEHERQTVLLLSPSPLWTMTANSSSLRSDGKRRITPPNWLRKLDRIRHGIKRSRSAERERARIKRSFYLIYGIGRGIIAGVADLRGVLRDRMIADGAVVAHDEAQQIYL